MSIFLTHVKQISLQKESLEHKRKLKPASVQNFLNLIDIWILYLTPKWILSKPLIQCKRFRSPLFTILSFISRKPSNLIHFLWFSTRLLEYIIPHSINFLHIINGINRRIWWRIGGWWTVAAFWSNFYVTERLCDSVFRTLMKSI